MNKLFFLLGTIAFFEVSGIQAIEKAPFELLNPYNMHVLSSYIL